MWQGFQPRVAATGKAQSPSIDRRVAGTTRAIVLAERSLCHELVLDTDFRSQYK